MNINIFENSELGSQFVAEQIQALIKKKTKLTEEVILGLATGSTPKELYKKLVSMYKAGEISFEQVITFNLDEYHPMSHDSEHSYHHFMNQIFFDAVDIKAENTWIPSGEVEKAQIESHCREYEQQIVDVGGIDLQLLGIGTNGHIGFNEPGSTIDSVTRYVELDEQTRIDAAAAFGGIDNVPRNAISMGIDTILKAKEIVLMAWGSGKAEIIRDCLFGEITAVKPATFLQKHPNVHIVLDREAAALIDVD
ncbi:MAG: glucosamine-6-phosphate deaminase [Balneolaceae bacterium]